MSVKRILILTLTAGGGHIQAAKAKLIETKAADPDAIIYERDILFDWICGIFGLFAKHLWGDAQASGNIFLLICLSFALRLADFLFWVPFFFSALRMCLKFNIDEIIDTQPLGTSAIIKALRLIKWKTGKTIFYQKVITDLPTEEAKHFFGGIKSLNQKDIPYLKILTTQPILNKDETEEQFWKKNCNLPLSAILYAPLPLRPAFFAYFDKEVDSASSGTFDIDLVVNSSDEMHITHKTLSYGQVEAKRTKNHLTVTIHPNDKVALMMLGANPSASAILTYTSKFIKTLQERAYSSRHDLFFIFCSSQVSIKPNLRQQLLTLIQKTKNYPKGLTIIPISHQNDQIVAPLLRRSNATLTRSGGLTSMELLSVSKGKIWIHKEPPLKSIPKFVSFKAFHEGMPPWERGNARYLEMKKGAKIITPPTFEEITSDYFPKEEIVAENLK